jgi:hypothetical protein
VKLLVDDADLSKKYGFNLEIIVGIVIADLCVRLS